MKTGIWLSVILLAATTIASAATNDLTATLQKGLFEEEANHNIGAAIQAYRSVINQFDKDRKLAATAVFRLAECYRKQGVTNEATAQYERVLREFPDQAELVTSSRQSLAFFGMAPEPSSAPISVGGIDEEQQEIRRIEELLRDSPDLINAPGKNGETLLQAAAAKGQFSVVGALINLGADVNVNRPYNISPLHYAAGNGHKSVVDLLIRHGAKLDLETDSGVMPLHLAAAKSYTLVAKALIDAGAPVNARVRQSVSRGEGDLQYSFAGGESPLDLAIANNSEDIAAFLVAAKADVNSGFPLQKASARGERAIVALLLNHGAELNGADNNGDTPLHLAASNGNPELVALLLARGADVNARNKSGATPLHAAAGAGNSAAVEALLAKGADLNQQDEAGNTPLRLAVGNNKAETVRVLLTHKANPDIEDRGGFTPLNIAVSQGEEEVVRLLLEAGADPNGKSPDGGSPLILAADRGSVKILGELLDHKADVEARGNNAKTALMIAAARRDKAAIEVLLAHKANPNARDSQGNSPLHFLAFYRNQPGQPFFPPLAVRDQSMRPSQPNLAVQIRPSIQPDAAIAELLLAAGADVNAQNNEGITPLQYVNGNHPRDSALAEVAAVLRKHHALENPPDFSAIRVMRKGFAETTIVFRRDTNGVNRFTLLEVLPGRFNGLMGVGQERYTPQPQQQFPFPDLSRITIHRYTKDKPNERQEMIINVLNSTNGIDCTKDVPLQFGDEIEIPEREHSLSEPPVGLTQAQWSDLEACLKRKVTFIIKGQPTELTLGPTWLAAASNFPSVRNVLHSSSDLSHIRVRRTDPVTGEVKELVRDEAGSVGTFGSPVSVAAPWSFNSADNLRNDLWLRDGDVIEVPDKP